MKLLTIVIILSVIFFLWNLPTAIAQFSEAGVEKFKVPVEAPDFTLKGLNGETISFQGDYFITDQNHQSQAVSIVEITGQVRFRCGPWHSTDACHIFEAWNAADEFLPVLDSPLPFIPSDSRA